MTEEIRKVRDYAVEIHASVNHTYDGQPYSVHLEMVYNYAIKFIDLLPQSNIQDALSACWTHDLIEDCRVTYNDLFKKTNRSIAEISYNLTNNKGKNRDERADKRYYKAIRACQTSTFVKICDRLANIRYSKLSGSSMFNKYKNEHIYFQAKLYHPEFQEMWDEMKRLLS